ncbi:unnamed protein product (macronuclear) [Paramecium tetraurelia]|uniref:Uncharacterized protein n=1 Tax=Paramecium tetraurelia TaxID=5888 RepID=A0DJA7_PARTE|nr:uncharacterized protein GSPATT00017468001 [Paramecium tetraurelia]CAK83124.1 unnamed protein product [Paramecium tetraurelia]|eukprot:XP_001450521.1 hypothetical protein (macronuclear) [Paramecium tetraurelia strain d4-2]
MVVFFYMKDFFPLNFGNFQIHKSRGWYLHPEYSRGFSQAPYGWNMNLYSALEYVKTSKEINQIVATKICLPSFKLPLQNSSLLPNVNPDPTILRICQNPLFEASGTLILQGQFINHQGIDLKSLFKSKGRCILEDLKQM